MAKDIDPGVGENAPVTGAQGNPRAPSWATISTMKEPPEAVMEFIAHHLLLGASEIIIFFDDPEDPAIAQAEAIPQVRAVRCDAAFVAARGRHAPSLPARQKIHARIGYELAATDWVIHIDADEFLHPERPLTAILAGVEGDVLRVPPFEALATPGAGKDGQPEHHYRGALPRGRKGARLAASAYGPFDHCLGQGMLSHVAGKFFVRTGRPGLRLAVHGPFAEDRRLPSRTAEGLRLLHFHGGDYAAWRKHLDRRLNGTYAGQLAAKAKSNYKVRLLATLQDLHRSEGEAGLERFFRATCTWGPEKKVLASIGALAQANLWKEAKRIGVFGGSHRLRDPGFDPETAAFEATVDWQGVTLRLAPDQSFAECLIARGEPFRDAALAALRDRLAGRRLALADLSPGTGLLALLCAGAACPGSRIAAVPPSEGEAHRLRRHLALNPGLAVELAPDAEAALAVLGGDPAALRVVHLSVYAPVEVAEAAAAARPDVIVLDAGRRTHALENDFARGLIARGYVPLAGAGVPVVLDRSPEVQG